MKPGEVWSYFRWERHRISFDYEFCKFMAALSISNNAGPCFSEPFFTLDLEYNLTECPGIVLVNIVDVLLLY